MSYTTPYPGTHFNEHAEELGIAILAKQWDESCAKHNVMETRYPSSAKIDGLVAEIVQETGWQSSVRSQGRGDGTDTPKKALRAVISRGELATAMLSSSNGEAGC